MRVTNSPEREESEEADRARHQLRLADEDRPDLHAAGDPGIGDGAEVGRPEILRAGAQRDRQPERAAHLRQHRGLQQPADDPEMHEHAGGSEQRRHQRQRQERVEPGEGPEPECREHGEHEKFAMRKIDDLHEPKN